MSGVHQNGVVPGNVIDFRFSGEDVNDKENISFPSEWKEFKKIFDKKNYARKECLTLPIKALKKVIQ